MLSRRLSEAPLFLGLDVGTQGTKGVLLGTAGIVGRASSSYGLIDGLPKGAAEQHPETWIAAVQAVVGELLADQRPEFVAGVGVSGQQHGFVPLDQHREVLRPAKLWCDTSTSEQAAALSEALGRLVPTGFTASKILWLRQHEPANFAKLRHVLLPHDYVNFRLTGELTMEPGDASGTGLFDPVAGTFDHAAMDLIDPSLAARLPELRQPGELAGHVDRAGAATFGLAVGTPVSTGGGDNMMSAIGSGAVRPGVVVLSLGTSGTVFSFADQPVTDPLGLIATFCGSAGGWLPLLCVMNLCGVTAEVQQASGLSHAVLTKRAAAVEPGCDGLRWLPYLVGERVPDLPSATGTLLGMRPGCLRPEVLYRAAIEGTSCNLAWGMGRLGDLGVAIEELRLVGGASRNDLWRQVLAEVCGVPVRRLLEPESAALGAALQAMWAVGRSADAGLSIETVIEGRVAVAPEVVVPDPAVVAAYRSQRAEFAVDLARIHGV